VSFTARRIPLGNGLEAASSQLVYRGDDAARLRLAAALIETARRYASAIVKDARKQARSRALHAAAVRRAREIDADRAFTARAMALDEAYRLARMSLTDQLESALDQVLAAALSRIGAQLPATQRLCIVCEQLAKAAGDAPAAHLHLCSADESIYRSAGIGCPWPLRVDDALTPGQCRLTTNHGEWVLDFDALIGSLASLARESGASASNAS
jgi:flagellar biosynthesis/type III secretory pathway protein FliH